MTVWASSIVGLDPFMASAPAESLGPFLIDGPEAGAEAGAGGAVSCSLFSLAADDAFDGGEGDLSSDEAGE